MLRLACLLLTALTGLTALVYQVVWHKYLAALVGSHSEATAVVLGIFLGGLSFGYSLFGRVSRRIAGRSRLLVAYGAVEAGIGLWALAFPGLFLAARALSLAVPTGADLTAFAADVLLTAALIGPPAVLMGGTVPLLTQALARGLGDATRFHALVYASNTAGAFFGALIGGFVLLPRFGLNEAIAGTGVVNLAAGALFVLLAPRVRGIEVQSQEPAAPAEIPASQVGPAIAAALLSGAAMMTLQVALNRVAAFSFGSSPFTFAMVVATFVSCIAAGSFAVSALPRVPSWLLPASQWALAACLGALYPILANGPYWAHVVRSVFRDDPGAFYPFWLTVLLLLLVVLLLPLALSGALLPLLFDRLRRERGTLGRVAGRIYSANTVGSLVGALGGGYALLFWLDLHQVYRLAAAAVAASAAILSLGSARGRKLAAVGFVVAVTLLALLPPWRPERLASGAFDQRRPIASSYDGPDAFFADFLIPGQRVRFYEDDPVASIAVVDIPRTPEETLHALFSNGKNDSALPGDHVTTGLLGLLPALFAETCERAFVIGYGTGLTTGELAALASMREVVVAEISPGVLHAAPLFEPLNQRALANPKTRVIRADAFRALERLDGSFDVISSEPSNPWVAGVETLYSREFLETARARLAPGGVFVQWMQTYYFDDATLTLVLETFQSVFGEIAVWHGQTPDLLLLGFADPRRTIDLEHFLERFDRPDFRAALVRTELPDLPSLLAHEIVPVGALGGAELPGTVHTLLHPVLNDRAARAFFVGGTARLPPTFDRAGAAAGARNSLARRVLARLPAELREPFRARLVEETCARRPQHCATLLAHWQSEEPGSPALADTLARVRRTPAAPEVTPQALSKLATLFEAAGTAGVAGDYEVVRRVVETFSEYYHHAAPFDAGALRTALAACSDPRCETLRTATRDWGTSPPPAPAP